MQKIICCIALMCPVLGALAQLPPIDTDRPDQTESVNLAPKRWLQFEAGFDYIRFGNSAYQFTAPTLLSKYGLSNRVELRLITTLSHQIIHVPPAAKLRSTVFEQVEVGAKVALVEEKKLLPKISWIFHAGIPGAASYTTHKFLFNTRLTMQHTLAKNVALGYNFGVEFDGWSADPIFVYTFSPGFNLSEKWYAYIEAFGTLFEHPEHMIDGGLAYYISNDSKVDISGGVGISPDAPKHYFSIGFSKRFRTGK